MKPLHEYVVVEEIKEDLVPKEFVVDTEEPTLAVGNLIAVGDTSLPETFVGSKVLFRKYGFDTYHGQLIGKAEHIIAIL